MKNSSKRSLGLAAAFFTLNFSMFAAERYVAVDGTGDGLSADAPMASLADAYAQAAEGATKENPGVVHVASGMYRLSEAIEMKPYVKVVGDETGPTIFSGEYLFEGQHVYHWCKNQGAEESKLTKNPLWNNDLSFNEPNPSNEEAWYCAYTGRSPNNCTNAFVGVSLSACDNVFENLTFTLFKYGAISVSASPGSRISFKKCRFYGDHVFATVSMDHYSIEMQNGSVILDDCEFVGCVGGVCCYGDPTEESIITNCVFRENSGTTALLFKDSAYGKVVDTRFSRNWTQTSSYGAAITDSRTYSETLKPIEISDCLFATNFVRGTSTVASQYGNWPLPGAISSATV